MATTVAPFIRNLWDVINDPEFASIISWDSTGELLIVHNVDDFVATAMHRVVKSPSFCAFVRQLNGYGFNKADPKRVAFKHSGGLFIREHPEFLAGIQRRRATRKKADAPGVRERARAAKRSDDDESSEEEEEEQASDHEGAVKAEPAQTTSPNASSNVVPLTLEGFAQQFGLTYGGKEGAPQASAPPPSTTSDAATIASLRAELQRHQQHVFMMREFATDMLTTMREIAAATVCPHMWNDGSARNLITFTMNAFLKNQATVFPPLATALATMPESTPGPEVLKTGLGILASEMAAPCKNSPTTSTASISPTASMVSRQHEESGRPSTRCSAVTVEHQAALSSPDLSSHLLPVSASPYSHSLGTHPTPPPASDILDTNGLMTFDDLLATLPATGLPEFPGDDFSKLSTPGGEDNTLYL